MLKKSEQFSRIKTMTDKPTTAELVSFLRDVAPYAIWEQDLVAQLKAAADRLEAVETELEVLEDRNADLLGALDDLRGARQ